MKLRVGYELVYECLQPTPMLLMLNTHFSFAPQVLLADLLVVNPPVPISQYRDGFGNLCSQIVAPEGQIALSTSALLEVPAELKSPGRMANSIRSKTCLTNAWCFCLAADIAKRTCCQTSRGKRSAIRRWDAREYRLSVTSCITTLCSTMRTRGRPRPRGKPITKERQGICRDLAHLAVTLCRAMNIPARYCTGYISNASMPPYTAMDFAAWFEAFIGGTWQTFDARNNVPRMGRVLMARGHDAADVAISNTFGSTKLLKFDVVCEAQ